MRYNMNRVILEKSFHEFREFKYHYGVGVLFDASYYCDHLDDFPWV